MYGKTLGVVEYNLTFGSSTRMVNVFGCFKYKKNNNLYVVYADVGTSYEYINYGSAHIKDTVVLSMTPRQDDTEVIKEYIYKVINNEDLSLFDRIDLTEVIGIEIISASNLPVKLEVIKKLEELLIPVINKEVKEEVKEVKEKTESKKGKIWLILILLLALLGVVGGGYFYLKTELSNKVSKKITCTKDVSDTNLDAVINETNTYLFYNNDKLSSVETFKVYRFNDELTYQDFVNRGVYLKYIPNPDAVINFDATAYVFEVKSVEKVDSSYEEPTGYEEVINYYSNNGYVCSEVIEKE